MMSLLLLVVIFNAVGDAVSDDTGLVVIVLAVIFFYFTVGDVDSGVTAVFVVNVHVVVSVSDVTAYPAAVDPVYRFIGTADMLLFLLLLVQDICNVPRCFFCSYSFNVVVVSIANYV